MDWQSVLVKAIVLGTLLVFVFGWWRRKKTVNRGGKCGGGDCPKSKKMPKETLSGLPIRPQADD